MKNTGSALILALLLLAPLIAVGQIVKIGPGTTTVTVPIMPTVPLPFSPHAYFLWVHVVDPTEVAVLGVFGLMSTPPAVSTGATSGSIGIISLSNPRMFTTWSAPGPTNTLPTQMRLVLRPLGTNSGPTNDYDLVFAAGPVFHQSERLRTDTGFAWTGYKGNRSTITGNLSFVLESEYYASFTQTVFLDVDLRNGVPESASVTLLGIGLGCLVAGLAFRRRRWRQA